jgi:hypothetical protein
MADDKIFNNRFNTGEIDFEVFGEITKINLHGDGNNDVFDDYHSLEFQKKLYDIYIKAHFYEEYAKGKKVPKNEVAKIYYYFEENFPNTKDVSKIDMFVHVAEFMSIEYHTLYQELGAPSKEMLLKELDHKYDVFKKNKIRRLF